MSSVGGEIGILLVEDDKLSAKLVETFLGRLRGFAVSAVRSAEDALAHLRGEAGANVSIVLTDNALPGASGIDLVKQIRADETLRGLTVAVMTASEVSALGAKATSAGADVFLTKAQFCENPGAAIKRVVEALKAARQAA